jgi:glycosyltransferase involved in cell wall biosynthesis
MTAPAPVVSVLMLTYNHAAFLQQAIASVQAQTLQAWELLIGEDGSTDHTATIALKSAATDARIRVFSSPGGSLGFHRNFARLLEAAQAPYVAFLEGDDWWSEPRKLDLQVSLLEQDPTLAFCGGRTLVLDQRLIPGPHTASIGPSSDCLRLALPDLIGAYSFHFSSVLMRRDVLQLPDWIFRQYCLDRPLYLLAALRGDAAALDQPVSVYRLHQGGVWAPLSPLQRAWRSRSLFGALRQNFPRHYRRCFQLALSQILWSYLADAIAQGQRWQTLAILLMGVEAAPGLRLFRQQRPTAGSLWRVLSPLPIVIT